MCTHVAPHFCLVGMPMIAVVVVAMVVVVAVVHVEGVGWLDTAPSR